MLLQFIYNKCLYFIQTFAMKFYISFTKRLNKNSVFAMKFYISFRKQLATYRFVHEAFYQQRPN